MQLLFETPPYQRRAKVELSPLLNVLLVLLVVVALGFCLHLATRSVPLTIPIDGVRDSQTKWVTLTLATNHNFFWDKFGPLPFTEQQPRLEKWREDYRALEVIIAGTEGVTFGDQVKVMDEVRKAEVSPIHDRTYIESIP